MTALDVPSIGVEEEFFLVDATTLLPTPRSEVVVSHANSIGVAAVPELSKYQVEVNSPVCTQIRELREHVIGARTTLAAVALAHGAHLVAAGLFPGSRDTSRPVPITDSERYRQLTEAYGALADSSAACGSHVHVEIPNDDAAVAVSNFVRPWLPTLLATTANSAIHDGVDTGHASWRSTIWGRWPTAGPPPYLHSRGHYEELVGTMLETGTILDEATLYWDVRPSTHLPTIEVRVGDVPAVADETALFAALVRALVMTAQSAHARRDPTPAPREDRIAAAYHCARLHGLDGTGVDTSTGRPVPARRLLSQMFHLVKPALAAAGDLRYVETALERLDHLGNGAQRQRRTFTAAGDATDVLIEAARATTSECRTSMAYVMT